MRAKATITVSIDVEGTVQVEANGLITHVLPDVRLKIGPHLDQAAGLCHEYIQAAAVIALESEARRLSMRPDPLEPTGIRTGAL
jgi:hypothetical protein